MLSFYEFGSVDPMNEQNKVCVMGLGNIGIPVAVYASKFSPL
jgi:UDP-N-acetyl-D-mannosaminuronate dehydrogenase